MNSACIIDYAGCFREISNDHQYCQRKRGTGKTTVSTILAVALDANIQFLDCDVEEPNSHLFIHPDFKGSETIYASVPEVDLNTCDRWGKCAEICRLKAITLLDKTTNELAYSFRPLCWPQALFPDMDKDLLTR